MLDFSCFCNQLKCINYWWHRSWSTDPALPGNSDIQSVENTISCDLELHILWFVNIICCSSQSLQIYAYIFENIRSVQLEALLLSLLSIVVLVLVKELNEKFQRNIKIVLPIDLVLVSRKPNIRLFALGTFQCFN